MLQVSFYKSETGNLVDTCISFATASWAERLNGTWKYRYSHCEFVFSDGQMFSSSGRDKAVRFKPFPGGSHWHVVNLPDVDESSVRAGCLKYVDKKYDYLGALGYLFPFTMENHDKLFCSEVLASVLLDKGISLGLKPSDIGPQKLYDLLVEYGYVKE